MAESKKLSLYQKLQKIQSELKAPKNLLNKFGGYKYRNAEGILEALKPYEEKYGVATVITDEIEEVGGRVYVVAIATIYDCDSEQTITVSARAREAESKKGMDEAQITGATSSYARKYALNGLFLLDDTKDADTDAYAMQNKKVSTEPKCSQCGAIIKASGKFSALDIAQGSFNKYGRVLCIECGKAEKAKLQQQKELRSDLAESENQ